MLFPEDGSRLSKHVEKGTVLLYVPYIYVQNAGFIIGEMEKIGYIRVGSISQC